MPLTTAESTAYTQLRKASGSEQAVPLSDSAVRALLAIGGVPCSASKSPIRRSGGKGGRQVDCLKDDKAYEFKIRITIAASGQGRWGEELQFPEEVRQSGYTPVLIVLDPTPNPKLEALVQAFQANAGLAFIGDDAWSHLKSEAGVEMSLFLQKYVREPLDSVYAAFDSSDVLPPLRLEQVAGGVIFELGNERHVIHRPNPGEVAAQPFSPR
jgi:hypothetical protein